MKSSFQAVGQDLLDNEAVLEAVNQEALDLLQELKQGEGLVDMLGFEEQLRLVNETWNEAKFQVQMEYGFFRGCWSYCTNLRNVEYLYRPKNLCKFVTVAEMRC